jgi:FkbM family methyltransferase
MTEMKDLPIKVEPFSIFKEVEEEFNHYSGPLNQVVDIGAHHGSLAWLAAERGAHVLAVEPYWYKQLCENIDKTHGRSRIVPIPFAVSRSSTAFMALRVNPTPGMASLLYNDSETAHMKKVPLIHFADLMDMAGKTDYLKIDIEGGEFTFLLPTSEIRSALKKVDYLHIEIHGWDALDYYYNRDYMPRIYKYGNSSEKLLEFLLKFFDLEEIVHQAQKRVYVGYHR